MKKFLLLIFLFVTFFSFRASAQYASQMDAAYLATLKAVMDYKIDDEENLKEMEELREDQRFNRKLQNMIDKLNNTRTKTGKDRRVYDVLLKAGKDIYNILK